MIKMAGGRPACEPRVKRGGFVRVVLLCGSLLDPRLGARSVDRLSPRWAEMGHAYRGVPPYRFVCPDPSTRSFAERCGGHEGSLPLAGVRVCCAGAGVTTTVGASSTLSTRTFSSGRPS